MELVDTAAIAVAAQRIEGAIVPTPLLPATQGTRGQRLLLKPENLQPTGAFKLRGAVNAVRALEQPPGVIAYSSGNHAQAVAEAARLAGLPAVIVIEETAPRRKIDATAALGAEVVLTTAQDRAETAERISAERGYPLIPPFDHPEVIAGQGTIGLEIVRALPEPAAVLVPISGGGLASGIGVAVRTYWPHARIYGVEPELAADTQASLKSGRLVHWPREDRARTIADGLRSEPSELTFAHLRANLAGVLTVTEDRIRAGVRELALRHRLVAEPSGAVALAAYRQHAHELPHGPVVAVISGGNIDPALLTEILAER